MKRQKFLDRQARMNKQLKAAGALEFPGGL
jgi:hypothetical protein